MQEKMTQFQWACIIIGLLAVLVLAAPLIYQYVYPPAIVPAKYMTGLTAKFKIYDVAGTTLVAADVLPEFWSSGVDPFAYAVTEKPLAIATYDTTYKYWSAPLDAGSYVLTIKDTHTTGSEVYYATKLTVTVPGTDSEELEVWITPKQVNIDTRAELTDVTVTNCIYPYNTTGTYKAVAYTTGMNTTEDAAENQTMYWYVEYTFLVSDADEIIESGRIYCSDLDSFIVESIIVDGTEHTSPPLDTDAADDGITGYYAPFTDWTPGRHHVTVKVHALSQITGDPTFTVKAYEYYECHRTALRWWDLVSKGITVES